MKGTVFGVALVAIALVFVQAGAADDDFFYGGGTPKAGAPPAPTGATGQVDKTSPTAGFTGKRCATSGRKRTCTYYSKGHVRQKCVTLGKRTTCTYYNKQDRAYKACVRKRPSAKFKCHKLRLQMLSFGAGAVAPGAKGGLLTYSGPALLSTKKHVTKSPHGFIKQGFAVTPPVGAIWLNGSQECTGTLVTTGIVVTAAHCLYNNAKMDGPDGYEQGPFTFAPGQTAFDGYPGLPNKQYGEWQAQGWWVPQAWADGDPGHDWGFMLLYPDGSGNFPGATVGAYDMYQDIRYSGNGDHVQLSGYPAEGLWTTPEFSQGVNQYYVEGGWDGLYQTDTHGATNYMMAWSSTMTGGSSGGPIFVELADHTWVIGGVISQGHLCCNFVRGSADPYYADYQFSAYFNDDLGQFWHAVFG